MKRALKPALKPALAVALVVAAAALISIQPDRGHEMFKEYRELYPGTPMLAEAAFVVKAERLCDAGMPLAWWETWPQAPSNAALWNLTIEHLCPEQWAHRVSVTP